MYPCLFGGVCWKTKLLFKASTQHEGLKKNGFHVKATVNVHKKKVGFFLSKCSYFHLQGCLHIFTWTEENNILDHAAHILEYHT